MAILALRNDAGANDPVFAARHGGALSERAVNYMLWIAAPRAQRSRPRSVTPMWQQRQAICTLDQTPHRASSSIRGSFGEGGDWRQPDTTA
jgi:hypothetical protein